MDEKSMFLVDIDKVVREKAGKKADRIPRFLISYLKRIVHQDEINAFLTSVADKEGMDFLEACVEYLDIRLEVEGMENLPDLHGLAPLCIPINKTGSQSRDFPRMVEAGFRSDAHIIMFPAGICSRRRHGTIKDLPWKKTFVTKSVETQRNVVPIHFEGRNSNFFYNLANACKFLGIKFNVAMLYLADEMYKNRHKTFRVTIGKPIPWQTFNKSKTPAEWADYVRELVYKL